MKREIPDKARALPVILTALTVSLLPLGVLANKTVPCAVLPFRPSSPELRAEAACAASKIADALKHTDVYSVISPEQANARLTAARFPLPDKGPIHVVGSAAGGILQVPIVFLGTISRDKNGYHLTTHEISVTKSSILRTYVTRFSGTGDQLPDAVAASVVPAILRHGSRSEPPIVSATERTPPRPPPQRHDWISPDLAQYLEDRLEIGTRFSIFYLTKAEQPYIGSIGKLNEQQNLTPFKLFAAYNFTPSFRTELAYDSARARTVTRYDGHTDGDFKISGPMLNACYSILPGEKISPYLGLGLAHVDTSFDAATWWNLGYPNETVWRDAGNPATPYAEFTRNIEPKNTYSMLMTAGCRYNLSPDFDIDILLRYMPVSFKAHYYIKWDSGRTDDRGIYTIRMDNLTLASGVVYKF